MDSISKLAQAKLLRQLVAEYTAASKEHACTYESYLFNTGEVLRRYKTNSATLQVMAEQGYLVWRDTHSRFGITELAYNLACSR